MNGSEQQRREFWVEQMDKGYELLEKVFNYRIEECCEALVDLREAVAEANVHVAFSTTELAPGLPRQFYLRSGLISSFLSAAREMNECGWVLKVEDGFRSRQMQRELALKQSVFDTILKRLVWENHGAVPPLEFLRKRLGILVALWPKNGTHMSGSAIDISVLDRESGKEIDRGAPYLEFSELTAMGSPFIDEPCRRNRQSISALMARHGFVEYPYEFWHYNAGDALAEILCNTGKPARYGPIDRDPATGNVTPIADPMQPLSSDEEIEGRIEQAVGSL